MTVGDFDRRDGLGNTLWEGTTGEAGFPVPFSSQYFVNGRLRRRDGVAPALPANCQSAYPDSLVQTYDPLGNLTKRLRLGYQGGFAGCGKVFTELDDEFYWYATDNQLAVVQRDAGSPDRSTRSGTWEEYHYDPLGRRISVRERRDSLANGANMESALTLVVWDGPQILYELRSPDGLGGPARRYGTVGYLHGRDLDAPLAYSDGTLPVPDWRGLYQGSVFAAGGGADCLTGGPTPCVSIDWPARNVGMSFRGWGGSGGSTQDTWKGSLTTGMRDGTGLLYRRNRYYDPLTGRFTQLDPLGLAGGANGYGFPNGDPVNFSDPFGLLSCPPLCSESTEPGYSGTTDPGLFDPTAYIGKAELKLGAALLFGVVKGLGREAALEGGRLVIGKLENLEAKGALQRGERTLLSRLSGDLGTPKANWARNAGALRAEMARGLPIRDASANPVTGALENNTGFLRAERGLLQERGWAYDAKTRLWNPRSP